MNSVGLNVECELDFGGISRLVKEHGVRFPGDALR
jgi:hypothetical protein